MRDAFTKFQPLQGRGYDLLNGDRSIAREVLLPSVNGQRGIEVPAWHVLNPNKPNGIDIRQLNYDDIPGKLINELGTVHIAERETGTTRLFLIWVSRMAALHLKAKAWHQINVHLLFHPPTYEDCYTKSTYWSGNCTIKGKDNWCEKAGMIGQRPYVQLGVRYLCSDFRAIAQHLLAVSGLEPNVIYVAPVADHRYGANNFNDILSAEAISRLIEELIIFSAQQVAGSTIKDGIIEFGSVMLSGYSRSGDRIEKLMESISNNRVFQRHLSQLNLFDINLDTKPNIRLDRFMKLCTHIARWKNQYNRAAHAFVYTAYPDHARAMHNSGLQIERPTEIDLDAVTWSDPERKKLPPSKGAQRRGRGIEAYNQDASIGLVHLPIPFFEEWLQGDVPPNPAGFEHKAHGSGHGHGWFHRTLMAHALAHADRSWYGQARK